ncbi:MAG: hypothetical protein GY941_12285 [Planctomycetes bacterium]|nr:hypothetical protein [Planctomycetota bacterium]
MGIEILNGCFDVWMAPEGEAYPDISDAPAGNWAKIGSNGNRHYTEEGVRLELSQDMEEHSGAGGTEVLKISRVLERAKIQFELFDLSSAEIIKALNLTTTTQDTAAGSGTGGHQAFSLLRGLTVTQVAILVRGENKSTDLVTENIQIEIPSAAQIASLEMIHNKSDKAGVAFDLQAIANYTYDPPGTFAAGSAPYGVYLIGDTVPS